MFCPKFAFFDFSETKEVLGTSSRHGFYNEEKVLEFTMLVSQGALLKFSFPDM